VTYIQPTLPFLLILGLAGIIHALRRPTSRWGARLAAISLAGIWCLSIEATAWVTSRPLEMWYAQQALPAESADAIVVLAGAVNRPVPNRPYYLSGQDTYRRVKHAAWLFHNWKPLPILVSGGGPGETPLAETMRRLLLTEGIPADRIWMESRSMNTHESAVYGSEILRAQAISRIALVVEANSMPRAARSFRRRGIQVVPVPARFTRPPVNLSDFLPGWTGIASNEESLHEIVGLAWYQLRGWI
jgi:uncharacterized SAM-binding protein YcdF (DUF218 family)